MVHVPTEVLDPLLPRYMLDEAGEKGGWDTVIHDSLEAMRPVLERRSQGQFDYSWTGSNPEGVTSDDYRVEWRGRLDLDGQGPATLLVRVAGRVRVDMDGRRVVDDWQDGALREHRIDVERRPGHSAAFAVDYGHRQGDAVIQIGWEMPCRFAERDPGAPLERDAYLPAGRWYDFWSGTAYDGPGDLRLPAPLESMPLLVRVGAVLPLGPVKQWQDEIPDDPIELRIYRGADGGFTLYEDAGDGYAYEAGACSEIDFHWDDQASELRISDGRGSFPGMLQKRTFNIVLVGEDHGVGVPVADEPDGVVSYAGQAVQWTAAD
jgi:alpha-D-xyloside xylohydrolase